MSLHKERTAPKALQFTSVHIHSGSKRRCTNHVRASDKRSFALTFEKIRTLQCAKQGRTLTTQEPNLLEAQPLETGGPILGVWGLDS